MPTGLEISRNFIDESLLPLLQKEIPEHYDCLAVAVIGTGSDVLGYDDQISRDHHWGPRANIMYLRQDAEDAAPKVKRILNETLPADYNGFPVQVDIGNLTGVCCCAVEDFFLRFLGTDRLPERETEWLDLCEVDLFHVTQGTVVYDAAGELTRRRERLAYYPENVWRKRIADWCMYASGRDSPYNVYRISKRGDDLTCMIYLGQYLKRAMELCFALNREYSPYTKWLNRAYRNLPKYVDTIAPLLDEILPIEDWKGRVFKMVEANYAIADAIADLGLTEPVRRREFDEGLTDLTLYDSAAQIYRTIPEELFAPSFNFIELWERMAREVLFDTNDYFQKDYESKT
jgi:hypothetical protein